VHDDAQRPARRTVRVGWTLGSHSIKRWPARLVVCPVDSRSARMMSLSPVLDPNARLDPTPSTVANATPFNSFQVCKSTPSASPA